MATVLTPLDSHLRSLAVRLGQQVVDPQLAGRLLELVKQRAPDEGLALVGLIKLGERSASGMARLGADLDFASDLIFCLGSSESVGNYLARRQDWWEAAAAVRNADAAALARTIEFVPPAMVEREAGAALLAEFKEHHFVRLAMADLLGRISVVETMELMSQLAEQCVAGALAMARKLQAQRLNPALQFCVIALGKLGVSELNLSSDVDLSYLFDAPDAQAAQDSAHRLGNLLSELLAGAFRVDLRLRPGGSHAPLVSSLESAVNFYQNFGQTWERAALLRARPVAGDLALGARLIAELSPFIYRRFLDFETLHQLRTMKQMIEQELRSPAAVESNIKLGRGGIRELEFIVQALTLVYGGRDPRLRYPRTLDALARLQEGAYLSAARARQLSAAYLFLRDVEHKLQVVANLQTHSLPADPRALRQLAARMGFGKEAGGLARFEAVLTEHRRLVAELFREMLPGGEGNGAMAASDLARQTFAAALEPEAAAAGLQALGFAQASESAGHLLLLARGPAGALASPRRRELLQALGPLLLDEISALPNPDHALANLAACIAAIGARTSFLTMLQQHPATRRMLLSLFSSSQYLSGLFIRHPEMLDVLVRSDLARLRRSALEIRAELNGLLAHCVDFESQLDAMRSFRHQEFLRVAIADVAGQLDLAAVAAELSTVAEAVLVAALELARQQVASSYPSARQLQLCVLAMGRLGAAEMAYNSDLDLIFVYAGQDNRDLEVAARVAQKLIAILEARTREGYLYKCDLRLRPSGNAGPLVTSLAGFIDYHRNSSATWERLALIRGRTVAGAPELGVEVEKARQHFVFRRALNAAEVAEIAAMRARIEHELGAENAFQLNLKQGPGGLIDVQFLTQMMALRYGHDHPQLRGRGVRQLLAGLKATGLMDGVEVDLLRQNYEFLERLESYLRMDTDQAAWAVSTQRAKLSPLARRMGFEGEDGAERMLTELGERRAQIRASFERHFQREAAAAAREASGQGA
ncbi:MAG TPA: bifunctional [glutamate--ammonia ligase]-adenylyl-L-tyrosine phosphorylase/[glutamate--ammonia-ligase] adenylyltransferase [Candidatus Binataceae bacterium]|nr:bifunctional [glutamate--ammonia ligase]-adenylyl-L-tyrosine phosphorylase/[glutamate--ammonia-ligase] adenylyltransferase [Candidatus Binataceae bacterium]